MTSTLQDPVRLASLELDGLQEAIRVLRDKLVDLTTRATSQEKAIGSFTEGTGVNRDKFVQFMRKPYLIVPKSKTELHVIVPKFVNFQVGWLLEETETFNVFVFNQYSVWLGDAPMDLVALIGGAEKEIDGIVTRNLLEFDPKYKKGVVKHLGQFLSNIKDQTATIKKGHEFDVIAEMIKAGSLPFRAIPVDPHDLTDPNGKIALREYQQPAYDTFMKTGAVGIFHPTGAGKTYTALRIAEMLRGPKLVVVPTITLKEQWESRIHELIGSRWDEFTVTTYQARSIQHKKWTLTIFDECQKLPANTFSRLALIDTKYRIGLSASPFREDGRENYIIALTGYPIGLNWKTYMETTGRKYHEVHVWVVKKEGDKIPIMASLIDLKKKTLIFCDGIELGAKVAKKYGLPHVYGETKDRMSVIENNQVVVVSRVADLGISIKNLQRVIEVDFLFGSRQQEIQRTGRLMHAEDQDVRHDIIMTRTELGQYGKRLWALQEKGFTLQIEEV